ncbi:MAG: hypothetical protein ACP5OB_08015 [Candidatus Ratteibacteria bacterium]
MELKDIEKENMEILEKKRKTKNPFARGIFSLYAEDRGIPPSFAHHDAELHTFRNVDIERIKDLGANCYTYLIWTESEKEFEFLPEFLKKAEKEGLEVWVYIVPPSEAPIGLDKPIQERKYPPFDMDYLKWAEEISKISVSHQNLTLWMIDDFGGHNLTLFTLDYTRKIYEKTKEINPKLLFGVCSYYDVIKDLTDKGYLLYFDAVLWGYQWSYKKWPDCGVSAKSLPFEINTYYKLCPGKILIPCIYFTRHPSWPKGRPTKEYLEKAIEISYKQAGICFVYTTPLKGTMQYDVVKNFINSIKLIPHRYEV